MLCKFNSLCHAELDVFKILFKRLKRCSAKITFFDFWSQPFIFGGAVYEKNAEEQKNI